MNMRKILLAVDGSEQSRKAAGDAADLARLAGAEVVLTMCYLLPEAEERALFEGTEVKAQAEAALKPFATLLGEKGVSFSTVVRSGAPAREIVALAEEEKCDLIVMGSRGLGKIMGLILGSVTKEVVQTAPCSVWVVR